MDVIETDRLTKTWGSLTAVSDLTLRVRAGECHAFLGATAPGSRRRCGCSSTSSGPPSEYGAKWQLVLDTATPQLAKPAPAAAQSSRTVEARSLAVLRRTE